MRGQPLRARRPIALAFIVGLLGAALAAPASVSAATPLTTFVFDIDTTCVFGVSAPNADIHVELRNKNGKLKRELDTDTDPTGGWLLCLSKRIKAGDRLKATVGAQSRTLVVRPLKFSINRVTNVIKGKSAKKSSVRITTNNCYASFLACPQVMDVSVQTNAKGKFSRNFSGQHNIRGGDVVRVTWTSNMGDTETQVLTAPKLYVETGESEVKGHAKYKAKVKVKLFNKNGKKRAVAKAKITVADRDWFNTNFGTKKKPVLPALGNTIRSNIAPDAKFEVLDFKPSFNVNTDVISAKCWANSPWYIYGETAGGISPTFEAYGTANGNGNLTLNTQTAAGWNLKSTDEIEINCRTPAGDEVAEHFVVP